MVKPIAGGAAIFRQSCVFRVFVGKPAFAKGYGAAGRKKIFAKVEVSAFSLGFQQNLAVVANDEPVLLSAKMPP